MNKIDLENLMRSIFILDEQLNGRYTHISQIGILTIKSLMPSRDDIGVRINYKRFLEEMKLWMYYRSGENLSLLNIKKTDKSIYWNEEDDSIPSRTIPIIIANQKERIIEEEVIRNILFTTGNLKELFEHLSISYIIYYIIQGDRNILESLKEKIIHFGQVEFLNRYKKYYRVDIEEYNGNFNVEFEKEKINIINLLNGIDNNNYLNLVDLIKVLDGEGGNTLTGKVVYNILYEGDSQSRLPKFYLDLGTYLINLRKSRINPGDLQIKEYILPDVFSFNEGDVFFHSLLRDAKVIKKEVRSDILASFIQTRTGMYVFKK